MYTFMCDFGFPNKYLLRTLKLIIIVNIYCRLPIYCVSHLEGENNKEKRLRNDTWGKKTIEMKTLVNAFKDIVKAFYLAMLFKYNQFRYLF